MDSDDDNPPIVKAKRRRRPINKKTKLHLVFNEDARKDFLSGFHKRKLQRKKKAQEELQELLKAEKKRIKLEAKEKYKKLVHSYKPIPELEEQFAKEYEVEDTTVSVLELDTDLLAETNFLIGRNRGQIEDSEIKEEDEEESGSDAEELIEEMPGMELTEKKVEKKKKKTPKKEPQKTSEKVLKTKKEIKKELKKQSTKSVKKSKVFHKLNEIHTLKQKKKATIKRRDAKKTQARGKKTKRSKFKNKK